MIRKQLALALTTVMISIGLLGGSPALAQSGVSTFPSNSGGRIIASEYGKYVLTTQSGMTGGAASTVNFQPCFIHVGTGNRQIFPFWSLGNPALNVPLQIQDGSNSETVYTESAASFPTMNTIPPTVAQYTCSVTFTPINSHSSGVIITSGDGGLMEAINDALAQGINEVDLDSNFTGTPSNSSYVPITSLVSLVDLRSGNRPPFWTVQPSTLTALTAPIPRVGSASGCTGSNTVCDTAIAVSSGGFTNAAQYVWVAYVDILGGISSASTTAHYTSAGAVQIEFLAPAASTGAVGWVYGIGTSYAAAYWIPVTGTCTLTQLETVIPACAMSNTYYGQAASNAFVAKPLTTFALYPAANGVAAAYNPVFESHTTFSYQPSKAPSVGFQTNFGPFPATGALTAGQASVLGTVALPASYLNYIGSTLRLTGKMSFTTSTDAGTDQLLVGIGDITDFTTGTPKAVCTLTETTAIGSDAAYNRQFQCDWTVNATGTTGSIMPDGFAILQLGAGTTAGYAAVESATGAITADVLDQDLVYIEYLQTTDAESTTPPQLQSLHVEVLSN